MKVINYAVVGVGRVFHFGHRHGFKEPYSKLQLICDISEEAARRTAQELGVNYTTRLEEVLAKPEIQAVDIVVPPRYHKDIAIAAARAGKHVLCEKPLAFTLADCDEIIIACAEAGVKLMVAENYLFEPAVRLIGDILKKGWLGRLQGVRFIQSWRGPERGWSYRLEDSGGGALLDDGIHLIALGQWFLGEVKSVVGAIVSPGEIRATDEGTIKSEVEEVAGLFLKFEGERWGTVEVNWQVDPGLFSLEFLGECGTATYTAPGWCDHRLKIISPSLQIDGYSSVTIPLVQADFPSPQSYAAEIAHFTDCILHERQPIFDGERARKALEVVLAGYLSARKGREVQLPLMEKENEI